ncbi:MAG: tyrosine--tRNA ligase, partial [Planctomycetota bacterium]
MEQSVDKQMERIRRGAADIVPEDELKERIEESIKNDEPLRVKLGLDPTAPDIHVGNALPLHKMRMFQDLGHHAVFIVGDFTATIGDPSGQNEMRPQLSPEEVMDNASTYLDQVGNIVDMDEAEIIRNSQWFGEMKVEEILSLAARITVSQCIERDDFRQRLDKDQPVGLHELFYPLLQAYDSVMVESDIELGGTDQIFNILMGRELQRQMDQQPQIAVTNPLLEGLDGTEKMSKSKGNYIGILDEPADMFGKAMSVPDRLMEKYLILATDLPMDRIDELTSEDTHPRDAKAELARAMVARYHGEEAAEEASREFDRVFREKKIPEENIDEATVPGEVLEDGNRASPLDLLTEVTGYCDSRSQARRLVKQGGVSLGMGPDSFEKLESATDDVELEDGIIL